MNASTASDIISSLISAECNGRWAEAASLRAKLCGGHRHVYYAPDGSTIVTCTRCAHRGVWSADEQWMLEGASFPPCMQMR